MPKPNPAPTAEPAPPVAATPRCIFLVGRGGSGKTLLLRWIAERAFAAGREFAIADGDRTNRSLPHYFENVMSPAATDERAVARWLEGLLESMVATRSTLLVDLGGGDQVLKLLSVELDLQSFLEDHGVALVLLHLIGPEIETLGYLSVLGKPHPAWPDRPLFAPARSALVLNERLIDDPNADPAEAFQPIRDHDAFRTALTRDAATIVMPRLAPALEINRRHLSFADAANGKTKPGYPPLGLGDRQRVKLWQRAMQAAFEPIAEWLP